MTPSPHACKPMSRDPRIDAYIEGAAPFAQPILSHVRDDAQFNLGVINGK